MTELKRIMTEFKVCRRRARGDVRLREMSEKFCKGRGLKKIKRCLQTEQRLCKKGWHFVNIMIFQLIIKSFMIKTKTKSIM